MNDSGPLLRIWIYCLLTKKITTTNNYPNGTKKYQRKKEIKNRNEIEKNYLKTHEWSIAKESKIRNRCIIKTDNNSVDVRNEWEQSNIDIVFFFVFIFSFCISSSSSSFRKQTNLSSFTSHKSEEAPHHTIYIYVYAK